MHCNKTTKTQYIRPWMRFKGDLTNEEWSLIEPCLPLRRREAAPQDRPPGGGRLALSVLLVRIARSDSSYLQVERDRIDQILSARYGLAAAGAAELRSEAEIIETEAPDTVRFTRMLKDAVPFEERDALLEALWDVALSDGHHADHEHGHMRLISSLLGISDRENALARRRVIARSQ